MNIAACGQFIKEATLTGGLFRCYNLFELCNYALGGVILGNRISINKLCRRCMNELNNEDAKCTVCGFDKTEYNVPREHLRVDCILKGKYLVGVCIRETEYEKSYIGWNLGYDTKVIIKEYFPKNIVEREDHESGRVVEKKPNYQEIFKNNLTKYINQAELVAFSDGKKINITETFQENGTAYYVVSCFETDPDLGRKEADIIASYELLKPSMYENPMDDNDGIPSEFRRAGSNFGRGYVQPAYHVQPARGTSTYTGEEKSTKSIAPNVLQGASVSYVKIMRPKSESLNMDMEELEKTRDEDERASYRAAQNANDTFAGSIVSTDGSHMATGNDSAQEDDGDDYKATGKIRAFFDRNRTSSAIAFVAVLFLIVGIRIVKNHNNNSGQDNSQKGNDKVATATMVPVTTKEAATDSTPNPGEAQKPKEKETDNGKEPKEKEEQQKPDEGKEPSGDESGNDDTFEFTDPSGDFAQNIASILEKDVSDITVSDIEGITELNLSGKGLTDITDIDKFTGLESLDISRNDLADISVINSMSDKLVYLNVMGNKDLVEQVPDILYVAGRKYDITVKFYYTRDDGDYSDAAIWVWTKDPGKQFDFEVENGAGVATAHYYFASDRHVGFKLKNADSGSFYDLSDDVTNDRQFDVPCNKEGTVVTVDLQQGLEQFDVSYEIDNDD